MITEKEFKEKFINKLNLLNSGWRDGDLDISDGMKVDIINDNLKIVIEIKDDTKFKMIFPNKSDKTTSNKTNLTNLCRKNRQFKNHFKNANKKFTNYLNYKSVLLLRTEMADQFSSVIKYSIDGPKVISRINGRLAYSQRPSTFWNDHDKSISEIGVILFWNKKCFYIKNTNPNINKDRILEKEELEKTLGINFSFIVGSGL